MDESAGYLRSFTGDYGEAVRNAIQVPTVFLNILLSRIIIEVWKTYNQNCLFIKIFSFRFQNSKLSDWFVSLAHATSHDLWLEACQAYANQLIKDEDILKGIHQVGMSYVKNNLSINNSDIIA